MKKRNIWLGVLLAALLLVSTILTGCSKTSESAAPAPNAAVGPIAASAVAPAATESSAPGAPQEGIKVHGHWTIEVRNPDGSLAERREFENEFQQNGRYALTRVLARQDQVGEWLINLVPTWAPPADPDQEGEEQKDLPLDSPWKTPSDTGVWAYIYESSWTGTAPNWFANLTVSIPLTGSGAGKLVLQGTATAQTNGTIGGVRTYNTFSQTYSGALTEFTISGLGMNYGLSVVAGQQIQVTVVISFS